MTSYNLLRNTTANSTTTNTATYTIPVYSLTYGGAQALVVIGQDRQRELCDTVRPPGVTDEKIIGQEKIERMLSFFLYNQQDRPFKPVLKELTGEDVKVFFKSNKTGYLNQF